MRSRPSEPSGYPVPAEVVGLLLSQVGMSEAEVRAMSRGDAIERRNAYRSAGR